MHITVIRFICIHNELFEIQLSFQHAKVTSLFANEFTNYLLDKSKDQSIVGFWVNNMPDFLIQRNHILNFRDSLNKNFSKQEISWFKNNYCLNKHFYYEPKILAPKNKFQQFILKLGNHSDYYLYVKKNKQYSCVKNNN